MNEKCCPIHQTPLTHERGIDGNYHLRCRRCDGEAIGWFALICGLIVVLMALVRFLTR